MALQQLVVVFAEADSAEEISASLALCGIPFLKVVPVADAITPLLDFLAQVVQARTPSAPPTEQEAAPIAC